MRVVVVVGEFGAALGPVEAAEAIAVGWHAAAPDDELTVLSPADDGLGPALDGAGLAIACAAEFDWQSLRSSLVATVAEAAVERGVPCVVIAGRVSVGRREASAIGVDAAYPVADNAAAAAKITVTNPAVTNPVVTNPVVTDPVVTDPAVTDPAVTDPAVTDPAVPVPAVTVPAVTVPAVAGVDARTGPGPAAVEAAAVAVLAERVARRWSR